MARKNSRVNAQTISRITINGKRYDLILINDIEKITLVEVRGQRGRLTPYETEAELVSAFRRNGATVHVE
jgi:hypothetical protein